MNRKYTPTREEYKEKFDKLFSKLYYIPQAGEEIKQCGYPYPDYWFLSNKGYLFSVDGRNIKVLKPYGSHMGLKSKGKRTQNDWFYFYISRKTNKKDKVRMHKLIAEYFLDNQFKDKEEYKEEKEEVHHKINKNKFSLEQAQYCNRADNLQILPKSVHKEVSSYTDMTDEKQMKKLRKALKKMKNPTTIIVEGNLTEWVLQQLQYNLAVGKSAYVITGTSDIGMAAQPIISVKEVVK